MRAVGASDGLFVIEPGIRIDGTRRQAVAAVDVTVDALQRAARGVGLRYPQRPAGPAITLRDDLCRALRSRPWVRDGGGVAAIAQVWLRETGGHRLLLVRDERVGTLHRQLGAVLDSDAELSHVVVDLSEPPARRATLLATFPTRLAASIAAQAVITLARPLTVDLCDTRALRLAGAPAGLDVNRDATAMIVGLASDERMGTEPEVDLVEQLCLRHGAVSMRRSQQTSVVDAADDAILTCPAALEKAGYEVLFDSIVACPDLDEFVLAAGAVQRSCAVPLTMLANGATGTVSCWTPIGRANAERARDALAIIDMAELARTRHRAG